MFSKLSRNSSKSLAFLLLLCSTVLTENANGSNIPSQMLSKENQIAQQKQICGIIDLTVENLTEKSFVICFSMDNISSDERLRNNCKEVLTLKTETKVSLIKIKKVAGTAYHRQHESHCRIRKTIVSSTK